MLYFSSKAKTCQSNILGIKAIALLGALFFLQESFGMESSSLAAELPTFQQGIDLFNAGKFADAGSIFITIYTIGNEEKYTWRERVCAMRYASYLYTQGLLNNSSTTVGDQLAGVARKKFGEHFHEEFGRKCNLEDGLSSLECKDYMMALLCFEVVADQSSSSEKVVKAYGNLLNMCNEGQGLPRNEVIIDRFKAQIQRLRELLIQQAQASEVARNQFLITYEEFLQLALRERAFFHQVQEWDVIVWQRASTLVQQATVLAFKFVCLGEMTRNSVAQTCLCFKQFNDELDENTPYAEKTFPTLKDALITELTDIAPLILPAAYDLMHVVQRDVRRQKISSGTVFKFLELLAAFEKPRGSKIAYHAASSNESDEEDDEFEKLSVALESVVGAALVLLQKVNNGGSCDTCMIDLDSLKKDCEQYARLSLPNDAMEKSERKQLKARCACLGDYILIQYHRLTQDTKTSLKQCLKGLNDGEISIKSLGERNTMLRDWLKRINLLSRGKKVNLALLGINTLFLEITDSLCLSALLSLLEEKIVAYQQVLPGGERVENSNAGQNNNRINNQAGRTRFHLERLTGGTVVVSLGITFLCYQVLKYFQKANREATDEHRIEKIEKVRTEIRRKREDLKHWNFDVDPKRFQKSLRILGVDYEKLLAAETTSGTGEENNDQPGAIENLAEREAIESENVLAEESRPAEDLTGAAEDVRQADHDYTPEQLDGELNARMAPREAREMSADEDVSCLLDNDYTAQLDRELRERMASRAVQSLGSGASKSYDATLECDE